jgi:hypothetical protein
VILGDQLAEQRRGAGLEGVTGVGHAGRLMQRKRTSRHMATT